jgi:hypothetical protein
MSDRIAGISSAAPTPWMSRPTTSSAGVLAPAAADRREREQRHAEREPAPVPEPLAEPRAADHEDRGGERVTGDHPFDRAAAACRAWVTVSITCQVAPLPHG